MSQEESISRGVPWTFVSFGVTKIISLVTTIVLARLLTPADFGLMALAVLAFGALGLFQDLGLGATLVLRQDFDDLALGTIQTLLIITSIAVAAIVSGLAPVAAHFFDEPRLNAILPVLSLSALFSTFAWFYESLMQREMDFKRRFAGQMSLALGFTLISIPLAIAGLGVWALVIGQVASSIVFSLTYLVIAPHRVRPQFDRRVAKEVFVSGRGFLSQGWLAWISENIDYLVVGRLLGSVQLGYYSMAYRLSELTHFGIADPVAKVTFPAFAKMRQRGEDVTDTYISALRMVALFACVIGAILSGAAEPFTAAVFGDHWLPMIGPLSVLGIWAAVVPVEATMSWLLNSTGHAGSVGFATGIMVAVATPLLIVAAHIDATAVSFVILGQSLVLIPLLAGIAHRKLGLHLLRHMGAIVPIGIATGLAWVVARVVANNTSDVPAIESLGLSALCGVAVYVLTVASIDRETLRLAIRTGRRFLARDAETTVL